MSTHATLDLPVEPEPVEDLTPVVLEAERLSSTAPEYLRDLKHDLVAADLVPAAVALDACFDEDCSLATQSEADRLREYVRAASFLGAARLDVRVADVADEDAARTALEACAERARREGVVLSVEGPIDLDRPVALEE